VAASKNRSRLDERSGRECTDLWFCKKLNMRYFAILMSLLVGFFPLSVWTNSGLMYYSFSGLLLMVMLAYRVGKVKINVGYIKPITPLLVLFLSFLFSALWALDPGQSIYHALQFGVFLVISVVMWRSFQGNVEKYFMYVIVLSCMVVILAFLVTIISYGSVRNVPADVRNEIGAYSNFGASVLILSLPFILDKVARDKSHMLYAMLLTLLVFGLLASASRSALVLPTLYLVYWLYASMGNHRSKASSSYIIWLMLVIVISITPFYFMEIGKVALETALTSSVERLFGEGYDHESLRALSFKVLYDIYEKYYPMGVGYYNFYEYMKPLYSDPIISHSILITMAGEIGLIGIVILLAFFSSILVCIKRLVCRDIQISGGFRKALASSVVLGSMHWMVRPEHDNLLYIAILVMAFQISRIKITLVDKSETGRDG